MTPYPPSAPLVGLGAAGVQGRALVLAYSKAFARGPPRAGTPAIIPAPSASGPCRPSIVVVVWVAGDRTAPSDLDLWFGCVSRDPADVVLGLCLGGAPPPSWPGRTLFLPAHGVDDRILTAALDSITEMLLGTNLVNLRVHELREVFEQGGRYVFAVGWGEGADCVGQALRAALREPALRDAGEDVRGLWMHVASAPGSVPVGVVRSMPSAPSTLELDQAFDTLAIRYPQAVCWCGGTGSVSVSRGARVSLIAVLAP